ncbi:hypothetical protein BE08_12930 [Sorangium cellulosum]|uniref:Uncharacterized protein n=1 Tax=Sorangium cellulosum TaxID=56 RepID=A0A150PFM8_SORCE|nr:hypothetical protein BE08_12930 [Sorangium cellulosum]
MSLVATMTSCSNCGAPLSVKSEQRYVICIFCNANLFVERPATGAAVAQIRAQTISKDDIERVKQLLVDGKRDEAVDHYARAASVPRDEAVRAVENVSLSAYWTLIRHMPINGFGFLLHAVFIFGGAGLAAWAGRQAVESLAYLLLVVAAGLFAILQLARFLRHVASTWVASFGSLGRARVLRCSVVRQFAEQDSYLVVALFEVVPDDGSPTFVDQETLLVSEEGLRKLSAGNVVRVRFDGRRELVFPVKPVTVLETAA